MEYKTAQVVEVTCAVRSTSSQLFVAKQLLRIQQLDMTVVTLTETHI